ncbi:GntR family transcriptional regulator [Microaerobacter geothermalis]|uniref:GntR family transcriptional regulator n=1 Tax=Microaerobacter geothermalis TaxID=674972 RepID=UPI001F186D87|nr:GntR family transcriptional regulator [Microaerobacter geothermalis]MCF6094021.1 GntR family transcriptional regulator [Microaerobacter geothermalis]
MGRLSEIKLDNSTLQEKVTATLRDAILSQKFAQGERLVQEELAEMLGVSRMPIREALRRLEMEGLVEMVPHKGAVVTTLSQDDIEEIYYLRSKMEGLAVEKSLNHLKKEDIILLEELVEKMDHSIKTNNIPQFTQLNDQFHRLLRKGCEWKRIEMVIQTLWNGYPPYAPNLMPDTMSQSNQEHKIMVDTVKEKDPVKLRSIMEMHIIRTGQAMLKYFKK